MTIALGFAVSPPYGNIRFTFALDFVDLGEDALSGDSLSNRTRIGMEIGFGPRKDGAPLFSLLGGWNATGDAELSETGRVSAVEERRRSRSGPSRSCPPHIRGLSVALRVAGVHVGHWPGPPPRPVITVRRSRLTRSGSSEAI